MNTPVTLTARGPEDLLAAVPCVLGFRPEDSVVLLTFGPPGTSFHARVDLPTAPDEVAEVSTLLRRASARNRVDRVALVAYSEDARAEEVLARLAGDFRAEGFDVVDVLRAGRERWFPVRPGRPVSAGGLPYDARSHPFAAQAVLAGRVTHGSREELAATLDSVDAAVEAVADAVEAVADAADGAAAWVTGAQRVAEAQWVRATVAGHVACGEPLTAEDVGRLLVALADVDLRDVAWATITHGNAGAQVELWRDVVRRSPASLLAPPAALLGFAAWLSGQGALAWCAVDRCLEADPGYSMAETVGEVLTAAMPPSAWQPVPEESLVALRETGGPGPGDPAA
jgi:hypothetical protein